ncbi:MAG: hypothetical protein HY402_03360 [Elusimicrobia bacterium]|nr:hypothetical protein [Elusimicrobiota bacterium]
MKKLRLWSGLGGALLLLLGAGEARSERVTLENGEVLEGSVREVDAGTIEVRTPQGVFALRRELVRSVEPADAGKDQGLESSGQAAEPAATAEKPEGSEEKPKTEAARAALYEAGVWFDVYLRDAPQLNSKALWSVGRGDKLYILEEKGRWVFVRAVSQKEGKPEAVKAGWIKKNFLKKRK